MNFREAPVLRVDRFLKLSRVVKRRSYAQEMITHGAVRVGGVPVRSSRGLKPGDIIEVAFPSKILTIKVTSVDESLLKRGGEAFELIGQKQVSDDQRPW